MESARGGRACAAEPRSARMNRALAVTLVALGVSVLAFLTALIAVATPPIPTRESRAIERHDQLAEDEATLLDHMVLMQRYVEKAALSAEAGNWPLTAFYAQKIDERAQRVIEGGYVVDGIDVSAIAAQVADPRAHALTEAAATRDSALFQAAYDEMVAGCNTCHASSGYGLVRIVRPDANRYPSQVFDE